MRRWLAPLAALATLGAAAPTRPPITGIAEVALFTTRPAAALAFWTGVVGAARAPDPERADGVLLRLSPTQAVELLPVRGPAPAGLVARIDYATPDPAGLRRYLAARGLAGLGPLRAGPGGARWFAVDDPEGVPLRFVAAPPGAAGAAGAISDHLIHAGHVVRDQAADDRFYRGLLGFRPYWYGGMRDGVTDWVSQQVPDGTDWYEYMLTAGTPDARVRGILNHVSLGVGDVRATAARLAAAGRLAGQAEHPQLGRDGKWQLNLYDPDGTRVELMDLHASGPPCCSPFTAADPAR